MGGAIVNVASVAGIDAETGIVAYATSKAAVIAFTKSFAQEMAVHNIRVNAVAPGPTDTDMVKLIEENAREQAVQSCALKRLAKPEEIADVVYFLSTKAASFVTGQVIRVDGGM